MKKTAYLFELRLPDTVQPVALMVAAALAFMMSGRHHACAQEKVWFDPMLMEQGDPGQRASTCRFSAPKISCQPGIIRYASA